MTPTNEIDSAYIAAGQGLKLYCRSRGAAARGSVLFIHGWSQSHGVWRKQLLSDLAGRLRLLAFDLRGHGYSECPAGEANYRSSAYYAQDIKAVVERFAANTLILVGWSSGSLYIADYLRHCGHEGVAGVVLVGGLHGLGLEEQGEMLGASAGEYMPDTLSDDRVRQVPAMKRCIADMLHSEAPAADFEFLLAQSMLTSPAVRRATMERVLDNTDVLSRFPGPTKIIQGRHDPFVLPKQAEHLKRIMPDAALSIYEDSAHMPFWEAAERFNRELAEFADRVCP